MDEAILNQEVFRNMDPEKLQIMKELEQSAKGKQLKDTAPLLINASQKLKAKNMSFTPQETSALIEVLTVGMSPAEKAKVEMMRRMVMK
jgi:hypothetical protein